jgi:molybdenum cofactor cytidylyltransferase|tara:strand:- start:2303 stop:2896 length:594 start_codon:yes stop_codon:yes gene_type:complete
MIVSATILAAGNSSRMGAENKLLLPIDGIPMICQVVNTVLKSKLFPIHLVTGFDRNKILEALSNLSINEIYNPNWSDGMASSIYSAVSSLPKNADGIMIVLGDMPNIRSKTLNQLCDEFVNFDGDRIIYPLYNGRQANPVIFPQKYFMKILSSTGHRGCKKLLKQYPEDAVGIPIASDEVILDCDTKDDYFQFKSGC